VKQRKVSYEVESFEIHDLYSAYLPMCQRVALGELPISADLYEHDLNSPCVLFIPGIGTYSEYYCEFLAKLSASGLNVLGVDLRGHGYSGGERGSYQVQGVVADLRLAIDFLSQRYNDQIGVIGSSIGSRLGLALAEGDSRVRSLLCHTLFISEYPPDLWHWAGWQSLAYTAFWMPGFKIDIRSFIDIEGLLEDFPLGRYALTDERMVWSYTASTLHSIFSSTSRIMRHELGLPASVIIGEHDRIIRCDYVRDLLRRATQDFELRVVAGGGHMLPLAESDRMVEESRKWFSQTL